MAKLGISTGTTPNDGTGDTLLVGAIKVNSNFSEIYNRFGDGTNLTAIGGTWTTNSVGIHTLKNVGIGTTNPRFLLEVGSVGTSATSLWVNGNARVTGILTIGTASITLNGSSNTVNVGSGITINGDSGSISVSSINVGGSTLTGSGVTYITAGSGISINQNIGNVTITSLGDGSSQWITTASGIHTTSNVGVGTTNPLSKLDILGNVNVSGLVTASFFYGNGINLSGVVTSLVGYATQGYVDNAVVGFITSGSLTGYATQGYVNNSLVGYATQGYVDSSIVGFITSGALTGYATEGYVNNLVAISTFSGDYNDLINTPNNLSDFNNDVGFVTAVSNYWNKTSVGIHTLSNVGIGTTNPTSALTVKGNTSFETLNVSGISTTNILNVGTGGTVITTTEIGSVGIGTTNPQGTLQVGVAVTIYGNSGIVSATTFYGNLVGSITNATNLTGGTANASTLNVSGLATISQGRIQADAGANLRFGNLPAGSGSGRNIAIGDQVLVSLSGGLGRNIGIGELSYYDTTTGQYNIGIGERAGQKVTTGAYNVILGAYDGQTGLDIRTLSNNVVIADGQGNIRQYINSSGNVGIKTTTITEALTVAGIVSATGFYGTLNASQLTGSLPAIDGSALTGVVATGTGIEIREDGSPVGTAGTINFGDNVSVSFASGIATVTGSGLATYANVAGIATYASTAGVSTISGTATYATSSGISTASGTAGYATTAGISSAVSATININTTGIITAASFSGSGSGLTNIPAGQLTGALPAIDGSALTGVVASGSGVVIRDDGSLIGTAGTIDFGTGLSVSLVSAGIVTVTSTGGSLQTRTTVTGVTTSITNNGIGNTDITGFKSYALMKVGLSTAGWLRLYTDSASRSADASRSQGIDPSTGSGVIAEVITTGISTTQIISPFVMGGNLNNPADTTIYAAITNLSGSTQTITANLTILQLEA